MTDDYVFSHDATTVSFDSVTTDGITTDEDGTTTFDWNEIPVVQVDEPPHARAFETDEFYKIEGATVARPIRQPYAVGDDVEVYVKPADELRNAAWSLDNRPFVLGHPSTGMVKDVRDVHGFWRRPRYNDDEDRLKQDLYIPKNDDDAKEFVASNQDVSLGFYNLVYSDYDGDIGGLVEDEEDVDGYQVNLYVDHIAGVERGRCSSAHGCGLDDQHGHGSVVGMPDEAAVESAADGDDKNTPDLDYAIAPSLDDDIEVTHDYRDDDGKYFAVSPDEGGGEPKFPINNCSDVSDAWKLRGHGDISISQDTLEERIKRRARELDCEVPGSNEDSQPNMTDQPDDSTDDGFDIPDVSVDALAEKNDAVRDLQEERDALATDLDEIRKDLGLDEDECPCDADLEAYADAKETVGELRDTFDEDVDLVEFVNDMHEEWRETRDEKREELLDELEDLKGDREEFEDEDLDTIEEEVDRRKSIAEDFDASGVGGSQDEKDRLEGDRPSVTGTREFARGLGT